MSDEITRRTQETAKRLFDGGIKIDPPYLLWKAFDRELSHYKRAKGSIQFPMNEPLPLDLIGRIVRFRAEEITTKTPR